MTDWMTRAACRGMDPEIFFPERGEGNTAAKAVCDRCPVRLECLALAVSSAEAYGVWGGLSVQARERLAGRRMPRGRVRSA